MSAVQSIGAAAAAAVAGEVLAAGKSIRVAANASAAAAATAADTLNFSAQVSSFSTSAANELVEHATRSVYVCLCVTAVDITANQSNKAEDDERRKG